MKKFRLFRLKLTILIAGIAILVLFSRKGFYAVNAYTDIYEDGKSIEDVKLHSVIETEYFMCLGYGAYDEVTTTNKSGATTNKSYYYYYMIPVEYQGEGRFISVRVSSKDSDIWEKVTDNTRDYIDGYVDKLSVSTGKIDGYLEKSDEELDDYLATSLVDINYVDTKEEASQLLLPYYIDMTTNPMVNFYICLLGLAISLVGCLWFALPLLMRRKYKVSTQTDINYQVNADCQPEEYINPNDVFSQQNSYGNDY